MSAVKRNKKSHLLPGILMPLAVMVLLAVPALVKERLSRWQGIVLLGIYVAFMALQFVL